MNTKRAIDILQTLRYTSIAAEGCTGEALDYAIGILEDRLVLPSIDSIIKAVSRETHIINHIRINGMIKWLIATSKGYYIATSRQEMEDYIVSLRGREDAIRAVRESMEKQLN